MRLNHGLFSSPLSISGTLYGSQKGKGSFSWLPLTLLWSLQVGKKVSSLGATWEGQAWSQAPLGTEGGSMWDRRHSLIPAPVPRRRHWRPVLEAEGVVRKWWSSTVLRQPPHSAPDSGSPSSQLTSPFVPHGSNNICVRVEASTTCSQGEVNSLFTAVCILGFAFQNKKKSLGFLEKTHSWLMGTPHPDFYRMTYSCIFRKNVWGIHKLLTVATLGMGKGQTFTFYFTFLYCLYFWKLVGPITVESNN